MSKEAATGIVFLLYMFGVFGLAIVSHFLFQKKGGFVAEYFLGSRGLGVWALAFSFAATSASGGSFTGYPSLIYTHGWVLAFWIASYMVVPVVTMGLMGKRLNQVARRAGAITIPDVLRERYNSAGLGLFASATIIFFTIANLVAQFKAGGLILDVLLQGTPNYTDEIIPRFTGVLETLHVMPAETPPGYIFGLLVFALTVVIYVAYGGFRAVVWTDVMQGVVMGLGVLILLPIVLYEAGGLEKVTREINRRPPRLVLGFARNDNVLEYYAVDPSRRDLFVAQAVDSSLTDQPTVTVEANEANKKTIIRVGLVADGEAVKTTAVEIQDAIERAGPEVTGLVRVEIPPIVETATDEANTGNGVVVETKDKETVVPQHLTAGSEMIFGPGRKSSGSPFHPLAMGISFFFMWAISGAGQPGTMVRLMAFRSSKILRRAIFTVTLYFGCIYLPMVFIFVAGQQLVHPSELSAGSDQIMPTLAVKVAPWWLAGILIAAPFAAVMSTVDSFLLLISSSLVRDIYQQNINPNVSEKAIKIGSYATTAIVGVVVTLLAFNPPEFLQDIIVFTGGGFASTFLAASFLGLYWKRMTKLAAWCAMVGGFTVMVGLHLPLFLYRFHILDSGSRINPLGFHPILVGLTVSFALAIVVSLVTPQLPETVVRKFFARPEDAGDIVEP